jgi:hypothetical protein
MATLCQQKKSQKCDLRVKFVRNFTQIELDYGDIRKKCSEQIKGILENRKSIILFQKVF